MPPSTQVYKCQGGGGGGVAHPAIWASLLDADFYCDFSVMLTKQVDGWNQKINVQHSPECPCW